MERAHNFIANEFVDSSSGAWLNVVEPATGAVFAQAADSDEADVDRAARAAREAFPGWSGAPAAERSRVLMRLAELIDESAEALAQLESRDTGKPISLARSVDIPRASANLRFFATAILQDATEAHETDEAALNVTMRRARGVTGAISPWNLPLYLFTWKIAPALAAGCTVVGKPSEVTPMTSARLGELAIEAGLPAGALNIVQGRGETAGSAIVAHPEITTLTFTGSTRAGAEIARTAGPMFKRISLECGGKNATLLFEDADLDRAIPEAARAAFANQGQICLCGSRLLIQRSIYDEAVERFTQAARAWRVGDPIEPETRLGALVSSAHLEKVGRAVEQARADGGEVLLGGQRADAPTKRCKDGFFYEPTVIAGLPRTCAAEREEIFGPVVTIQPFEDEREALDLANATEYGLAGSIWTENLSRAHRVAGGLEAGIIWVNCWMLRDLRTPFGGMKRSGVGREGGFHALHFFTEPKNVCFAIERESR